ncbi:MAG: T9SS type A sorting domain-containing protein, partial [Candidatus Kapabacteria bacterium]|nr:T9SS type A sorting domain-containing protein [Candidatus Kapabacteria bacterium]
ILASAQQVHNLALSASTSALSAPVRRYPAIEVVFALLMLVLSMLSLVSTPTNAQTKNVLPTVVSTQIKVSTPNITVETGATQVITEVTILGQSPQNVTLFAWLSNHTLAKVYVAPGTDSSKRILIITISPGNYGVSLINLRGVHKHSHLVATAGIILNVPTVMTSPSLAPPLMSGVQPQIIGSIPNLSFMNNNGSQAHFTYPFYASPQVPVLNTNGPWMFGIPENHIWKNCIHASFKYSTTGILVATVQFYKGIYILRLSALPKASGTVAVTMILQYGIGSSTASVSQTFNVTVAPAPEQLSIGEITFISTTSGTSFFKGFQTNLPLKKEHFTVSYNNPDLMNEPQVYGGILPSKFRSIGGILKKNVHGMGMVNIVAFDGYSFAQRQFTVQVTPLLNTPTFSSVEDNGSVNSSGADTEIGDTAETYSGVQKSVHESSTRKDVLSQKETIAMKAFPNPASNVTTVEYNLPEADDARVEIFSAQGMKLRTLSSGSATKGQNTVDVDVSDLQSGTYMLSISSKKYGVSSRSITVVR